MGDVDKGCIDSFPEAEDLGAHLVSQLCVQIRQWLIHQHHLGLSDYGPADGNPLPLASTKLLRLPVKKMGKTKNLRSFPDSLVNFSFVLVSLPDGKGHVVVDRHMGIEGIVLEHHCRVPILRLHIIYKDSINVQGS